MKSQLKALKGSSFKSSIGDIRLLLPFREQQTQPDEIYFTTNIENASVKIIDLETQECQNRFLNEKTIYENNPPKIITKCRLSGQVQIKNKYYGYFILQDLNKDKMVGSLVNNRNIISILMKRLFECAHQLKQTNKTMLNVTPENMYISSQNNNKVILLEPVYMTNRTYRSTLQSTNEDLFERIQQQYKYWSPQLLDNFANPIIDYRSDLFVMGCIICELLTGRYPFQSRQAVLSSNVTENLNELGKIGQIIKGILQPYNQRSEPEDLLRMTQLIDNQSNFGLDKFSQEDDQQMGSQKTLKSQSNIPPSSSSLFDDLKLVFNKYTKETEGWYLNYAEDNSKQPSEKYLELILKKIYCKSSKIDKLCSLIQKHVKNGLSAQCFVIKTLLLIGNLLRKGPWEVFEMGNEWKKILQEIITMYNTTGLELIVQFCKMLKTKIDINRKIGEILHGNFHLEDLSKFKELKLQTLHEMTVYLKNTVGSLQIIVGLKKQQLATYVINFYCDEIYDLLSMLILSVISLRKDNQLQLRQDQIKNVEALERKLNQILRKVSTISNYVNAHAIYSIEVDYSYYKQEIQLKHNPYYSTLQHFYRSNKIYKGLCVPTNYAQFYLPTKMYGSGDCNTNTSKSKNLQSEQIEDCNAKQEDVNSRLSFDFKLEKPKSQTLQSMFDKVIIKKDKINPPKIIKTKIQSSNVNTNFFDQKQSSKAQTDIFSQFGSIIEEPNKIKKSEKTIFQQFKFDKTQAKVPNRVTQSGFGQGKKLNSNINVKKSNILTYQTPTMKVQTTNSNEVLKKSNIFEDFHKFVEASEPKNEVKNSVKQISPLKKAKKEVNEIFNMDWLKEQKDKPFDLGPIQTIKQEIQNPFLKQIQEGIKLNELKELLRKNTHLIIKFNQLKLEKVIGSGSAGQVFIGTYQNQTIAIKKVKTHENPNALKEFQRELVTYIKIKKHPNLVSLVGLSQSQGNFYLLTEFCNSGSLFDLLHKKANTVTLSWKQRYQMCVQIAKGMQILHSMKPVIIHRDLKSLNVFVNEENGKWIVKVADFGLSRSPEAEMMTSALGTLHWMAPQLLENKQYSLKVDVYSYGILLWEICSRKTPYHNLTSPMAILKYVTMEGKRPGLQYLSTDCPGSLILLMQKCWAHNPSDRPHFNKIIQELQSVKM